MSERGINGIIYFTLTSYCMSAVCTRCLYVCVFRVLLAIACNRFFTFTTIMASTLTHLKTHIDGSVRGRDCAKCTTKRVKEEKRIQRTHYCLHFMSLCLHFDLRFCVAGERVLVAFGDYVNRLVFCYYYNCTTAKHFVVHNQKLIPYDISVIFFFLFI